MSHEGIRIAAKDHEASESEEARPLPRIAVTPEKVRVLITEGKGMEIDWADGHRSAWSFAWLREACPCATCVDVRKAEGRKPGQPKPKPTNVLPMYTPPPKPAQRPRRRPLRHSIQLARRPLRRHLLLGLSAPRLPVPRVHLRRRRNHRHAELRQTTVDKSNQQRSRRVTNT